MMHLIRAGMSADEILHQMEAESRAGVERVRAMLREEGREDILQDFDRNLRENALGITKARSSWDALTQPQRTALRLARTHAKLRRSTVSRTRYDAIGGPAQDEARGVCGLPTLRALCKRELLHPHGPALDVEANFVITEHGRFVLRIADV